jgi:hypothetical protein
MPPSIVRLIACLRVLAGTARAGVTGAGAAAGAVPACSFASGALLMNASIAAGLTFAAAGRLVILICYYLAINSIFT